MFVVQKNFSGQKIYRSINSVIWFSYFFVKTFPNATLDRIINRINTATIHGPADQSNLNDASNPNTQPSAPKIHPNAMRVQFLFTARIDVNDGTIKKAKTRRTPAALTENVTTIPKAA